MKIINLGILAHVDAGKTTLTESLLYTSGAIAELGSVDEGTTRTDTMNLERQRGITIQTAVTSFQWEDVKVNIIDTPGHMDFLAEVYRSLSVLDGAVLLVSAKDGIQAQTRILFHALQIMKIPTIFFINKIDQEGIDLPMVYREMKAKLSSEIIVKQKVGQHPHINVTDNDDMEQWDAVIMGNDELLEKYMSGKPFKMSELEQEENRRFQNGTLFPVYHGSAKNNLGIRQLIEVIASKFYSSTPEGQSELCGQVFKIEYSEKRRRFVYVRIYSGTLHLRDVIRISEKEKIKITEMCVPTNGELYSSDTACSGDIVILPNDVLQLNSILGNEILLPQRKFIENPLPMLQTTIAVKKSEQREILLGALTEISDGDPLLKYYVDTTTHEIILSFLGNVQMEVICAILEIEPLPIGSGVQYESRVSLGYLNQSFQNAVMEGVLYGCEQGLYGWKVTDCKICFEYGLYYSPVSTPADFRLLSPIVLEQALKKAGTELLEPYLHFEIYAPQEYLSRAYHDAPRYCADIVSTQIKNDEVILKGEIPARCIQEYRNDLTYFTNGQGVCLTELKGYQPAIGKFICQPRRPNSRIDKVRHMFHKLA
ncbi:MAG: tetracycline resistance ribosomal protection protein Tet(O) [Varibaculum cambriense]|uniref:tetracycline resistance ribosomal protection protein Tet(O) n=1 Tax=Varibaculum cambriense TaxID=184870 RepID=UPI00241BFE81|nr:tetracycline resistance ribosomal protection protein Tet(O) [Varibaculum cambriense]MBS6620542.1 tetracycline resistance ribosomal protection protein Tet(O) [Varibaculum cambriense]